MHMSVLVGEAGSLSPDFHPTQEFLNLNTTDTLGPINAFVCELVLCAVDYVAESQ